MTGPSGVCIWDTTGTATHCNDYTQGTERAASGSTRPDPRTRVSVENGQNLIGTLDKADQMMARTLLSVSIIFLLVGIGATSQSARAQAISIAQPSPVELVRTTVANEVAAANDNSIKHLFLAYKKTAQGTQTRIYVETREAMAGMTIAYNDRPLTPQQLQSEEGRLAGLANHPDQLERKNKQEKEEAEHTLRIVKALPDAFLFDPDGEEDGTPSLGREGVRLVRLKFRPNPAYHPPSHVEEALVGMRGVILIDPAVHRIARIDGTLFKEVTFGWGILGHLDKGGHFLVEQRGLDDGSWDISHMSLRFTGKVLLFKSISINSDEGFSNFRRVPADTTFAQGVQMLEAEQARLAQSGADTTKAENRSH